MLQFIKRAIISVSDKRGLVDFARNLADWKVELISTGGTASALRDAGLHVIDISDYTGFPEMMGGRVKTLHPKVHGGLLAVRDNMDHLEAMEAHGIKPVDLLVVNLYPFERVSAEPDVTLERANENIDIGGPAMIRSAAKNHRYTTVVVDPDQYESVVLEMRSNHGRTTIETRYRLKIEAFRRTAAYDNAIAEYLSQHQ